MNDESILGLLLRSHAEMAAQAHGERYLHKNDTAASQYEMAKQHIVSAIKAVFCAERSIAHQEAQDKRAPNA